jgi:acetyl-CoA carboxylase biotin carboxylase subunit
VDSHLYDGYRIPTQYDSMVGKLIAWAPDRLRAIDRMLGALHELEITGFKTTAPILSRVLAEPAFQAGDVNTHFLERLAEPESAETVPVAGE